MTAWDPGHLRPNFHHYGGLLPEFLIPVCGWGGGADPGAMTETNDHGPPPNAILDTVADWLGRPNQ